MRFPSIRTRLVLAFALAVIVFPFSAAAQTNSVNVSEGLTLAGAPLALRGYDAVSYQSDGKPTLGSAEFQVVVGGATYRFLSEANKRAFEANPERYVPAFGGFCAYGVSVGKKFDGDPLVWKVVDSRLYLNLNPTIQATWEEDVDGNIRKAGTQWRSIRDRAPADL